MKNYSSMKTMVGKAGLVCVLLLMGLGLKAQQMPIYNQYPYNPFLYNPAMAGADGYTDLYFNYKRQWTDIADAPDTKTLTIDGALANGKVGLGGQVFSDNTHILQRIGVNVAYAYYLKFNKQRTHYLSLGINAGFMNINLNTDNATIRDLDDELLNAQDNYRTRFDMGLGINYHFKGLNVGFSVPQLGSMFFGNTQFQFDNKNHYVGSASYDIRLGKEDRFGLEPMAMVRWQQGLQPQFYGHLKFDWEDKIWVGAGYQSLNSGANASFGFRVHDVFSLTYMYEVPVFTDRSTFGHTHEVMIGFRFGSMQSKQKINEIDKMMTDIQKVKGLQGEQIREIQRVDSLYQQLDNRIFRNEKDIELIYEEIKKLDESTQRILMMDFLDVEEGGQVFFKQGKYDLDDDAKIVLDNVIEMIDKRKIVRIEIIGYASTEGDENSNLILSNNRCASVKEYMLENSDLPYEKILTVPNGESNPMIDDKNLPYDQRTQNRRVDIFILYDQNSGNKNE